MTRPTARGWALLAVAVAAYLAARTLGTWELYLLAFAFAAVVLVSWLLVLTTCRGLRFKRTLTPDRPVAGDPLRVDVCLTRGSPAPGVRIMLAGAAGDLGGGAGPIELERRRSGTEAEATAGPWPARRGVHRLPPMIAVAEDPFGVVRNRLPAADGLEFIVVPRLTRLTSCPLVAGSGTHRTGGRLRLPAVEAAEFRSIRPHVPGEPLNRVDWKATAKMGALMLRETEGATGRDVTLLLGGAAREVTGEDPETNFELAVQAAGSLAEYALSAGQAVTLLLPDLEWQTVDLPPGEDNQPRLLEALATATPSAPPNLGAWLHVLIGNGRRSPRRRAVTIVVLSLSDALVRSLITLRREGLRVCVVLVDESSFDGDGSAAESRSLRLSLAAADVPCMPVSRGDDLRTALATRPEDGPVWARRQR